MVDNDRCRIQSFSEEGKLLSAWGSYGDGSQQFRGPSDIAVDSGGNIFVADYAGFRIKKFSHDGTLLAEWQDPPESPASPFVDGH